MKTPICDFVKNYVKTNSHRLHVPGHKGKGFLGIESFDVTEIDGADDLYSPSSIIFESENNASKLFNCPTFYTTEGSSHAIRAMIFLVSLYAKRNNKSTTILATRNVHKSFLTVTSLLNIDVEFIIDKESNSYLSSNITPKVLENYLKGLEVLPCAFYITSPDYLGNIADIKGLKKVLDNYGVLLLVDNAHGAYLKFLNSSLFPIDLGADMCASSAHKTLPVLTGGAYLSLSIKAFSVLGNEVKNALSTFGSTSPSYLILQSLDNANKILNNNFKLKLEKTIKRVLDLKNNLQNLGLTLINNEPLKITISPKTYGYTGIEFKNYLYSNKLIPEFYDNDYVVLAFSVNTKTSTYKKLYNCIKNLEKREPILLLPPNPTSSTKKYKLNEVVYSNTEIVNVSDSENKVYAEINLHCPPAVPIIIPGEIITKEVINAFIYYNIDKVKVIKE
ncbi:MAG: amino acid decarboxylase [Clostridia bacterium]|nr:amino acid decarboxylase [Clostridia bacterium]